MSIELLYENQPQRNATAYALLDSDFVTGKVNSIIATFLLFDDADPTEFDDWIDELMDEHGEPVRIRDRRTGKKTRYNADNFEMETE